MAPYKTDQVRTTGKKYPAWQVKSIPMDKKYPLAK
jgi:hypothetical protein